MNMTINQFQGQAVLGFDKLVGSAPSTNSQESKSSHHSVANVDKKADENSLINSGNKQAVVDDANKIGFTSSNVLEVRQEVNEKAENEKIEEVVIDLNSAIQNVQRNLAFTVDKELEEIVVNITDRNTDEVIRQIPSEEFLDLARNIQEMLVGNEGKDKASTVEGMLFNANV